MNVKIFSTLLLALGMLTGTLYGQKNYTKAADKKFEGEAYFEAIELYKTAYAKEASGAKKAEILFKIGECYRSIRDIAQAETWYKKAISANYQDPLAVLRLAQVIKSQQRYDEALTQFNNYVKLKPEDPQGKFGVESCELAQKWKNEPAKFEILNEVLLNSKQIDYAVAFTDKKYNSIIFSSSRDGATGDAANGGTGENFADLFTATRDNKGKWSVPVNLSANINTDQEEGAPSTTEKGSLYFTRCKGDEETGNFGCKIYSSKKSGQNYSEVMEIKLGPDSFTYGHPAIAADESFLIFSSNMPGGSGGMDIWMAAADKKTKGFSAPVNLGNVINTSGDEVFPYLHEDGSLYYSSDGLIGMGGLDIFLAQKTGDKKWAKPQNMRFPLNSAGDDLAIVFEDKARGYFTSNREGGKGAHDIYSFFVPSVIFKMEGKITNGKSNEPIEGATIKLMASDGTTYETKSDATGYYEFDKIPGTNERYIKPNMTYKIEVSKDDHLNAKGEETTVGLEQSTTFVHDFGLIKFKGKDPNELVEIEFPEVLYDFGKYTLRPESKDSLNFLYQTLIDNPTIVIELSAHTDSRGSDAFNLKLSDNRAKSCVDYLIEKGIDSRRMHPKGYGESRVLISDVEINKLPTKEEQEAAHQKNRRTVFSVLRSDFTP